MQNSHMFHRQLHGFSLSTKGTRHHGASGDRSTSSSTISRTSNTSSNASSETCRCLEWTSYRPLGDGYGWVKSKSDDLIGL